MDKIKEKIINYCEQRECSKCLITKLCDEKTCNPMDSLNQWDANELKLAEKLIKTDEEFNTFRPERIEKVTKILEVIEYLDDTNLIYLLNDEYLDEALEKSIEFKEDLEEFLEDI